MRSNATVTPKENCFLQTFVKISTRKYLWFLNSSENIYCIQRPENVLPETTNQIGRRRF